MAHLYSQKFGRSEGHFRIWAKFNFSSIKLKKLELLHEAEALGILKESCYLTTLEAVQKQVLLEKLGEIHKQKEIYCCQHSKLQWLKECDENMKFFHAVANGRRNQNFIPSICQDDVVFTNPYDIGKVFSASFQQRFDPKWVSRFKVGLQKLLEYKHHVKLSHLEHPFTLDEIKGVVFDLGGDKAPCLESFPLQFFKQFWDMIKLDLLKLCEDFYCSRANLERIKWDSITLIPKTNS